MKDSNHIALIAYVVMIVCYFLGIAHERVRFRDELIQRGVAEYNPRTGEFQYRHPAAITLLDK